MKKAVITAAALFFFGFAANAQEKKQPAKNAQVESAPTPAPASDSRAVEKAQDPAKPKEGTRMAITEKGIPASKAKDTKDSKPAASDKAAPSPAPAPKH